MNSARPHSPRWLLPAAATLIWPAVIAWAPVRPVAAQSVWELTPYRIQLIPAVGPAPELTPALQEDLSADLLLRIDALVGAPWDVTIATATPALRRAMIADVEAVAVEALLEDSLQFDKVMLLAVLPAPTGYLVAARDLDVRTRTWNTVVRVPVWQAAKLRDAAFHAVRKAFAPLAQIALSEDEGVTLRLRAAGLPTRDESVTLVAAGDLFRPVVRYDDREGNVLRVVLTPWTFLSVQQVSGAELSCKLHTGLRSPLSGRRRGNVEQLALAVVPPRGPTRLILVSRTDPDQVLAGYDVYDQSPDSKATELLGRSDRQGGLTIRPGADPLRVLLVKHGGALLARLPLVPGLDKEISATVPNDDQRLEAEGFILGLQEDLVDLVTRREVLLAQARARLNAKELDEADTLVRQLQRLKTRDQFARELDQEKDKIYSDDAAVQRQIDSMFDSTKKLLKEHLDPKVIENLSDELARVRSAREAAGS